MDEQGKPVEPERRDALRAGLAGVAGAAGATGVAGGLLASTRPASGQDADEPTDDERRDAAADRVRDGRLEQSVCRWCYGGIELDALCRAARALGAASVELLSEDEWEVAQRHGLNCAVANGPGGIPRGWNRLDLHDDLVARSEDLLPKVAAAGLRRMIVFSGNREAGLDDAQGLANCAAGLRRITPLAEELGVTIVMELLNSKRDHRGYMCDRTPWGVELVRRVESDRFRLLYDIYHMQIMEGDVIATIREHGWAIDHYHTGGVPGRREIDESQELYYPAICRAIADSGYTGYLGQEFIPSRDPLASLAEALRICTV